MQYHIASTTVTFGHRRPTRLEAQRQLEQPLRRFEEELRQLKTDYDGATANGKEGWHELGAAFQSAYIVDQFISNVPGWQGLNFGLTKLVEAGSELGKGRIPEWMSGSAEPKPLGPKPLPDRTVILRARCAAVMELLMLERSRKDAAKFVLRHLPKGAAEQLGGRRRTWHTIAGWRDQVTGFATPETADLQRAYQFTLDQIRHNMTGPLEERAEKILRALAKEAS